jgi:hypothetical protein
MLPIGRVANLLPGRYQRRKVKAVSLDLSSSRKTELRFRRACFRLGVRILRFVIPGFYGVCFGHVLTVLGLAVPLVTFDVIHLGFRVYPYLAVSSARCLWDFRGIRGCLLCRAAARLRLRRACRLRRGQSAHRKQQRDCKCEYLSNFHSFPQIVSGTWMLSGRTGSKHTPHKDLLQAFCRTSCVPNNRSQRIPPIYIGIALLQLIHTPVTRALPPRFTPLSQCHCPS